MKRPKFVVAFCAMLILALAGGGVHPLAAAETAIRVSAAAPIELGDVAGAQAEALRLALEDAVQLRIGQILPERSIVPLSGLLAARILPRSETFVRNYQIEKKILTERSYAVQVSVSLDSDLLRKALADLGAIREPSSPPLGAVFITVDASLGSAQVKSLGALAEETAARRLEEAGVVVIPPPAEGDYPFRVIRPPQTPESLVANGLATAADLAVGILFKERGPVERSQTAFTLPLAVSIQVVEVGSGAVADVDLIEARVSMSSSDGKVLGGELAQSLSEMARRSAGRLRERRLASRAQKASYLLEASGTLTAPDLEALILRLQAALGEEASIVPLRFERRLAAYTLWTVRTAPQIKEILDGLSTARPSWKAQATPTGFSLTLAGKAAPAPAAKPYGEDVRFYRRLPAAGREDPEDVRKVEKVPWREAEPNDAFATANTVPLGEGVLGRVEPSRDRDFFRVSLPDSATEVSVQVELTGPSEIRPRVRVLDGGGRLLADTSARSRGKSLTITTPLRPLTGSVVVSVEDDLARNPSPLPYVATIFTERVEEGNEPP